MDLLIDTYNLLHAPMPVELAGLNEERLCHLLAVGPWRKPVLVCDGKPKPGLPTRSPVPGVRIVFSGVGKTADDWIIEAVATSHSPKQMTIVTNDRQIQKHVRRRRARVLTCEQFIRQLETLAASQLGHSDKALPPSQAQKPDSVGLSEQEVERWLKRFGLNEED